MNRWRYKKGRFLVRARNLYGWGLDRADIERLLGVSTETLYRWQAQDRAAGLEWDDLRAEMRVVNPTVLVATLERRMQEAADREDLTPNQRADALLKLSLTLQVERQYLERHPAPTKEAEK